MCGITGFLTFNTAFEREAASAQLLAMMQAIAHRGPDAQGQWLDTRHGVALGHLRLAIVDVSPAGLQPMASASGRYTIVYNGEIYNAPLLRQSLNAADPGRVWRGHSDTEVLLAGFDAWGLRATLDRAIGMFAMAVWDAHTQELILVRDRVGEKPLYYGWVGQGQQRTLLFGSELKALRAFKGFQPEIDRGALCTYMRHMAIAGEHSIYQGIKKVQPGTFLRLSLKRPEPQLERYWSGAEVVAQADANPFAGTATEAVDTVDQLLRDAVAQQMMADVPLGAFLSGGVDSSVVVALMQAQSSRPVKTFSIGFEEDLYNEAPYAKAVAQHLGTDHTELIVTPAQALAVIPRLPFLYDEPFADSSQIPTHLVSALARQHVTVSLSGDAGDELFAGYNRYGMTQALWHKLQRVPLPVRVAVAKMLTSISPTRWNQISGVLGLNKRWANLGEKLHKGAAALPSRSDTQLYRSMVSTWSDPEALVLAGHESSSALWEVPAPLQNLSPVERMMALDLLTYLPSDILTKVDRAAMGVSLETRVPMLDHRVIELAWRLPMQHKLRHENGAWTSKWVLRQVLDRYVPRTLIERPKMGFGVPIDTWLRGPLKTWANDLLDPELMASQGYLHPQAIRQKWQEHQSGQRNWQHHLWCVLMFQQWLQSVEG